MGRGTRSNARRSVARRSGTSRDRRRFGRSRFAGRVTVGRCLRSHGTESRLGIRCTDSDGSVSPRGKYLTARSAPCRAGPRTVTSRRRAREADPPGCTRAKDAISCDGRAARARTPRDSPSGVCRACAVGPRDAKRNGSLFSRLAPNRQKGVPRDLPPAIERRGRRANRAGVERTISAAVRDFSIRFESSARVARVASSTRSFSPRGSFRVSGRSRCPRALSPPERRAARSMRTSGGMSRGEFTRVVRFAIGPTFVAGGLSRMRSGAASGVAETALRFF